MSHRTFNEAVRAVGYVHYDSRGTRDAKKACVIFLQQVEHFARHTAVLILKGVSDPNFSMTFCNVPAQVNSLFVQQVQMSTTGEYVAFTCSELTSPDSRPRPPMLFRRVPAPNAVANSLVSSPKLGTRPSTVFGNANGSNNNSSKSNNTNNNNTATSPPIIASYDLEACDDYISQDDDLNGDTLQSLYFPQYVSIGDVGTNHVIAVCCAENGTRTCYTVKLQSASSAGFFSFSFLKRTKKLAAASTRHVPGTDLILTCQHKMSDSPSINMAVRHFSLHTIRNCGNFERIYEVALGPELSRAWTDERLMNGYVFWDSTCSEEAKLLKDLSLGSTNASSSNHYHLPKISSIVVSYILYDYPVRASACGAHTDRDLVYRHVVRLFVFRPRNKNSGYNGSDWYIDLYFMKKNIAIFQISSLGQMCILCPGYKAYFVDVKYFGHEVGPAVSAVQYLDSNSLAHQHKLKEQNAPSSSATASPQHQTSSVLSPKAVPIPTKVVGLKGNLENEPSGTAYRSMSPSTSLRDNHNNSNSLKSGLKVSPSSTTTTVPAKNGTNNNNNNTDSTPSTSTAGAASQSSASSFPSSPAAAANQIDPLKVPFLEENCFVGEKFPDAFLRPNCIPSKLPPVEITSEQGKFVIFYSTHISAVLFMESRKPIWQAAQLALLRDRQKRKGSWEKNHDGEHAARGMLSTMDRAAMSLVTRTASNEQQLQAQASFHQQQQQQNGQPTDAVHKSLTSAAANNNNNSSVISPLAAHFAPNSVLHLASVSSPTVFHDHATRLEIEDTQFAFLTMTPVFQQLSTQLRDPTTICMEWIIAAAYLRLGTRQNPPPRLTFDFTAYEGIIYPITLPRTTAHARLRGNRMRTSLITGGTEAAGQQRLVPVHPRDTFVKAVELRLDDSISYRNDLVKSFRMFVPYEEALIEMMFPAIYRQVKDILEPMRVTSTSFGRINSSNAMMTLTNSNRVVSNGSSGGSDNNNNNHGNAENNNMNRRTSHSTASPSHHHYGSPTTPSPNLVHPDLLAVNEFCFLLCRLTALDLLGIRIEEKSAVVTSTLIFVAAQQHILPFNALARSVWQRTISNQNYDQFSVLLNPLTRFANKENNRLNVRVNNLVNRTTAVVNRSNMGGFFNNNNSNTKKTKENDEETKCTPEAFASASEPRRFFPSFSPSLISDKPFSGTPLPALFPISSGFERPEPAKRFLKNLRSQFAN